ncbi:MAG: hypothetical protein JWM34_4909 [Ilumatobacteraceae bacterium]|nr:hypothetical protein [Ilumatobacteraceae bacterium]
MVSNVLEQYHFGMARSAGELPHSPVIDVIDDGLTDDAVADQFAAWLTDLEAVTPVELQVTAADELHRAYADDDV